MATLLAIVPHPDDEAFALGGTLALAARAGWRCLVHCASAGERGKRHDGGPAGPAAVGAARMAELHRSCSLLGVEAPVVWGLPDGALRQAPSQADRIIELLGETAPDLVLALGADGAYGHPDHIAVHSWILESWQALESRPRLLLAAFPKGLFLPQYEKCLHMMGNPPDPSPSAIGLDSYEYELSIGAVKDLKLAAIRAHCSQLPGGDPEALFPPGIVAALLGAERFTDARGARDPGTAAMLAKFAGG